MTTETTTPAVDKPKARKVPDLKVGDLVSVTYLDPRTGADVVRVAQVVELVDGGDAGPAARVGYLQDPTDPIPLDHEVGGREDQPRLAKLTG